MAENFALIIGINHYVPDQDGLDKLNGPINDATKFHEWVIESTGGNVPEKNIKLVTSTEQPIHPNSDWVNEQLQSIFDLALPQGGGDRLYFYFAGHGLGDKDDTDNNALCMPNWTNRQSSRALSTNGHHKLFNNTGLFKEVIYITDCCRTEKWNARPQDATITPELYEGPYKGKVSFFKAFATQYGDQAYEVQHEDGKVYGIFTSALVDGLRGAAADKQGKLDGTLLRNYLLLETVSRADKNQLVQAPVVSNLPHDNHNISFNGVEPLITDPEGLIDCVIQFKPERNGKIKLEDSDSDLIAEFDPAVLNPVTIKLKKELHLLTEISTGIVCPIKITPNQTEPSHVEF